MQSAVAAPFAALVAVLLRVRPSAAQHTLYRFATHRGDFGSMASYLRWVDVEPGDVHLATKFRTGCSAGEFGSQFHSDGSRVALLAVWDADGDPASTEGVSAWCKRFSQGSGAWPAGAGVHCVLPYPFDLGPEYRFELKKAADATGTLWSLRVSAGSGPGRLVGSIFTPQLGPERDCSLLLPEAESFLEYYAGGAFRSAAAWRGPFLGAAGVAPVDADVDCGAELAAPASASDAVPGGAEGPPTVFLQRGAGVAHGCERPSLWRHPGPEAFEEAPAARGPAAAARWAGALGLLATGAAAPSAARPRRRGGAYRASPRSDTAPRRPA